MHCGREQQTTPMDKLNEKINAVTKEFEDAQRNMNTARELDVEKVSDLETIQRENNIIAIRSEFKLFGEILIQPKIEYYINNMMKNDGSLFMIQNGYCGVNVFDPKFWER